MTKATENPEVANQNPQLPERIHSLLPTLPPSQPIFPPTIDSEIPYQPILQRTTAALIYCIQCLEYTLSPHGLLRRWFQLNFLLMIWIGIPTFTLTPILAYLMGTFVNLSTEFHILITNLYQSFLPLGILVGVLTLILVLLRK
jgi:hypothetical protein